MISCVCHPFSVLKLMSAIHQRMKVLDLSFTTNMLFDNFIFYVVVWLFIFFPGIDLLCVHVGAFGDNKDKTLEHLVKMAIDHS